MIYIELQIESQISIDSFINLKTIYDEIAGDIMKKEGIILSNDFKFNNHIGDITKEIRWTWAVNKESFGLFEKFVIYKNINSFFRNEFRILGAGFITLYEKDVCDSEFHLDINTHYDTGNTTNILTLIFPLYIDEDMGGLEYKESGEVKVYKYKKDRILVWDACKLEHRTQPYRLNIKKKRVLVSMNLASNEEWAIKSVENTLKSQGNILF